MDSEKRSPGKLALGMALWGSMEIHGGKKIYAKNLRKEAAAAMSLGQGCLKKWLVAGEQEHAIARHDVERGQGGRWRTTSRN